MTSAGMRTDAQSSIPIIFFKGSTAVDSCFVSSAEKTEKSFSSYLYRIALDPDK